MSRPPRHWPFWGIAVALTAGAFAIVLFLLSDRIVSPARPAGQTGFFDNLFKVYTPRQACMFHEPGVVWLHLVSDLLIGLAYFSIPVALVYFVRRRHDVAFGGIFWMFAAFILACGTTHFVGVWDLWQPMYKVDGLVKAATAAIPVTTAIALWPLLPKLLALPSPAQLEQRVADRTAELARTNDALRVARGEAERANRMKDEFLATLSHELRTPLQAMLGWARILEAAKSQEQIAEGLAVITRNAQAQKKLIEDLLDMSRIEAGKLSLDGQDLDFAEVVSSAVATMKPAAEARELTLKVSLMSAPVRGDAGRLQQVVWNLLSNAVKFTPRGGRIDVRLDSGPEQVELSVTDTGEGIQPEFLSQLFQRFSQSDASSSRRHGGLGIGLALARHIVELHGGTVSARSDGQNKGSTFVVKLPRRTTAQGAARSVAPGESVGTGALAGLDVLVVEDEQDTRQLFEQILRGAGATVVSASSVREAMERLQVSRPDVLLCDLGLPDEDGFALIRRLRTLPSEQGGKVPAIAVTAFARPEDRAQCLQFGFQAHVAKPFDPEDLIATIAAIVGPGRRRDSS